MEICRSRPSFARSPVRAGRIVPTLSAVGLLGFGLAACGGSADAFEAGSPRRLGSIEDLTPKRPDFALGAAEIVEPGKTVEVLRLRALVTPNMRLLGGLTTWPRDGQDSAIDSGLGYPPSVVATHHPAFGTVVPAAETAYVLSGETEPRPVFVVMGFRLADGEVGLVHDMEVTYRVGDDVRRVRTSRAAIACMSPCRAANDYRSSLRAWDEQLRDKWGVVVLDSRNSGP